MAQDVCITDPVAIVTGGDETLIVEECDAKLLPPATVALRLLEAMVAGGDYETKSPAGLVREAFDLAGWFLRIAKEGVAK